MESLDTGAITPFHTFDPIQGLSAPAFANLLDAARRGEGVDTEAFSKSYPDVVERLQSQGIAISKGRDSIEWDDATLLFLAL